MRILATFDESAFSEATIPTIAKLTALPGMEIVLFSVVEVTAAFDEDAILERRRALEIYLQKIATRLPSGARHRIAIDVAMYPMEPGTLIAQQAQDDHCEIVVMATHGRTGLIKKLLGSVANDVVRSGVVPVLLVHPGTHH